VRLLCGPAGSGKTFRCLAEAREELIRAPEGPALVFVAPKQTTYQLERQLLAQPSLAGYTRLHILSFERLAGFVFDRLGRQPPALLDEEGRVMVLRGLLARDRSDLKLFRASAKLAGFSQQISEVLRELERGQLTPEDLRQLASQIKDSEGLGLKLADLASIFSSYLEWLKSHELEDADRLLPAAAAALVEESARPTGADPTALSIGALWLDGFAEFSTQELELLAALVPFCGRATITFCLEPGGAKTEGWLSPHWTVRETFEACRKRLAVCPAANIRVETLPRASAPQQAARFEHPALARLEACWAGQAPAGNPPEALDPAPALRVIECADPEKEVTFAAREILRHARRGGRWRDAMVLARSLEPYHRSIRRVFRRCEIPHFIDRREPVTHHPLAELTRGGLRTVASDWKREEWFAALKTGFMPASDEDIDRLENEALARGWSGRMWLSPIVVQGDPALSEWVARIQSRILPPFRKLGLDLKARGNRPTGPQLAAALKRLWESLGVERQLQDWAGAASPAGEPPSPVHQTVWEQMNRWLDNIEVAFPTEALTLREWLPILEAGLANLSVGVIPPALDQVLVGAVDRSRNPDAALVIVLGLNETVFPALPAQNRILTEMDRVELSRRGAKIGGTARQQLAREQFYAYLAFTRARRSLALTRSLRDAEGAQLNPSSFLTRLKQIVPALRVEVASESRAWADAEHPSELAGYLLSRGCSDALLRLPAVERLWSEIGRFGTPTAQDTLGADLAQRLYGPVLKTSVSRLEQFAACPFKFFVHSGLRAEEREKFELDTRERGTFQHDVLAEFHHELQRERKRWRDLTPDEAATRIENIAHCLAPSHRDGLFAATHQSQFAARILTQSLQDFVRTLVEWMRGQYLFDPVAAELAFGETPELPPWRLELEDGRALELRGRIDRVDVFQEPGRDEALCVVLDYKSSEKKLDTALMANGLQLQLPAYLNVLRRWPDPRPVFGVSRLVPAGVFYVNLRGKFDPGKNRSEALEARQADRNQAYRHTGRFDAEALLRLDSRGAEKGDQFNYRLTASGKIHGACKEPMPRDEFLALLDSIESTCREMAKEIFAGTAKVLPYRKGAETACRQCDYSSVCRMDPWTQEYRVLRKD
jgi:ATP-dependent helicase/nuclease subunit B